eukprot:RCo023455
MLRHCSALWPLHVYAVQGLAVGARCRHTRASRGSSSKTVLVKLKAVSRDHPGVTLTQAQETTFEKLKADARAAGCETFTHLSYSEQGGVPIPIRNTAQLQQAFAYYQRHLAKRGEVLQLQAHCESAPGPKRVGVLLHVALGQQGFDLLGIIFGLF